MQTRNKSRLQEGQPWSEERLRALNKLALLQRAVERADKETPQPQTDMRQQVRENLRQWAKKHGGQVFI